MNQAESFRRRTQQIARIIQKLLAEECEACAQQAESVAIVNSSPRLGAAIAEALRDRNTYR